ncbi:MAG: DUF447 family protein [Methanosarcina barkeri]|nr:DUF447 family protein [Methanosarcina sp. ERenArc_MAG2]
MTKFNESGDSCKPSIDLSEYGISAGISETIVSTGLDTPNAAPIGIIRKNKKIFVRIFKGSQTGENLVREGVLVANVVYDPCSSYVPPSSTSNLPNSILWILVGKSSLS